jgi:hypothetical protein
MFRSIAIHAGCSTVRSMERTHVVRATGGTRGSTPANAIQRRAIVFSEPSRFSEPKRK